MAVPYPPNNGKPPYTFGTGNPANISAAGVTQTSGMPISPADVNAYLTQLGGSVNGFAGQVTNALNALLTSGIFSQKQVRIGINPTTFALTTQGNWCGCAQGGTGSVITPQVTGRIMVLALITYNLEASGREGGDCLGGASWGRGPSGPDAGTPVIPNASGIFKLNNTNIPLEFANGLTGGTNFQATYLGIGSFTARATVIGGIIPAGSIVLNQPVWVDIPASFVAISGTPPAPVILAGSCLILVEY